jgi:signal transduction histidine kinase
VIGTDAGGIRLFDPTSGEMVVAAFQGLNPEEIQRIQRLDLGLGFGERLSQFREPLVLGDLRQISQLAAVADYGFNVHAYVPVMVKGKTVGVLGVISRQQREFTTEELNVLTAIGNQIGVAIENDRLRQQALTAERLAAVGRVATSVAHDLRSPLGGIVRSAEFLARPELSPETRQKLSQAIVSLARRLINTAQEILDYARGGQLPLHLAPHLLPVFLEQVLSVMEVDFADRGIEVVRTCTYTGTVVMDADRIAQVVYNIAANARDAMPHGGTFTVSTQRVGEWIELAFADTGPGVPEELRDRIFEPFFTQGKREGAGLGLAIARRIVEEHGGELKLDRHKSQGAVFIVDLPA